MSEQPAPLSDERLAEIEGRHKAAMPGPWKLDGRNAIGEEHKAQRKALRAINGQLIYGLEVVSGHLWVITSGASLGAAQLDVVFSTAGNLAFVLHAPEDVSDLLAEVRRLKGEVERGGCI